MSNINEKKKLNLHPEGDHVIRALGLNGQVKLTAIRTTETVKAARDYHDLSPVSTIALGRFMTGLQLMSQDLKNPGDLLSAVIKSDGPLKGMTVVAHTDGTVKGYVENTLVENLYKADNSFDIAKAVGQGSLTVSRKQAGTRPYAGTVELVSGEIGQDLTYYLYKSEQIPTILALGVLLDENGVKNAGGFLAQVIGGSDPSVIDYLEARISGFPEISYLLDEGFDPAQILNLFIGADIEYLDVRETKYYCDCSREKMESALLSIGAEDLKELSEDEQGIDITCEFCNQNYHFTKADMQAIYNEYLKQRREAFSGGGAENGNINSSSASNKESSQLGSCSRANNIGTGDSKDAKSVNFIEFN